MKTVKKTTKSTKSKTTKKTVKTKPAKKPAKRTPKKKTASQTNTEVLIPQEPVKVDRILELARIIKVAADDTKAENIITLDLRHLSTIADYLVICSATNPRQMKAISENVIKSVSGALTRKPLSTEGTQNNAWILVDYGDVVCHVFTEEMRQFYRLEQLWHDAKKIEF